VSVSIQQLLSEMTSKRFGLLVHLGTVYGIFEGHGSEFTVHGHRKKSLSSAVVAVE